jgi:hypothetical protein
VTTKEPSDATAAAIRTVRGNIGNAAVLSGRAAGKLTCNPEKALADLDAAIELLTSGRALFAATAGLEATP